MSIQTTTHLFLARFKSEFQFSVALQIAFIFIGAITLDEGVLGLVMGLATFAYWISFALTFLRRRLCSTFTDKLMLRWGFLCMVPLIAFLVGLLSNWRVG